MNNQAIEHFFISRGANINSVVPNIVSLVVNKTDMISLHMATMEMHVGMVRTLSEAQAQVNLRDANGKTPLHIVCKN